MVIWKALFLEKTSCPQRVDTGISLDQAGAKRVSGHDGIFRVHKLIQLINLASFPFNGDKR
jgi:hypothetical protein